MTILIQLIRLQKQLQCRRLTPEVGIYRAWVKRLIEIEKTNYQNHQRQKENIDEST